VLSDELGLEWENTAKWLHEHHRNRQRREQLSEVQRRLRGDRMARRLCEHADRLANEIDRWSLRRGQLVMVDEASLAGTFALGELAAIAADAGAELLPAGNPYHRPLSKRDGCSVP
jgi:hypothetical protein